jgi:hypothetical protein
MCKKTLIVFTHTSCIKNNSWRATICYIIAIRASIVASVMLALNIHIWVRLKPVLCTRAIVVLIMGYIAGILVASMERSMDISKIDNKTYWNWLKEKGAEALVSAMAWMALIVLGFSCFKAWRADGDAELQRERNQIEITKIRLESAEKIVALTQKVIEMNNETVLREAELLNRITVLEGKIAAMGKLPIPPLPEFKPELPKPEPPSPTQYPNQAPLDYYKQYKK